MTIREQIAEINAFFSQNRERYQSATAAINTALSSYTSKATQLRRKFQNERTHVNSKREEVLVLYRIAKDNTRSELSKTGKKPRKPDITLLSEMLRKIDEHNYNDATATKMVELIGSYIVYFDNQIAEIDQREKVALRQLKGEQSSKLSELESRKKSVLKICTDYLASPEVCNLRKLLDNLDRRFGFRDDQLIKKFNRPNYLILYGYQQIPFLAPSNIQSEVKKVFGQHYVNKCIDCPCGLNLGKSTHVAVEYVPSAESEIQNGIRAIVINVLKSLPLKNIKISIFDSVNYSGRLLGDMSHLAGLSGGVIEAIAQSEDELKQNVKMLAEYYRKVERKIGGRSVSDYNGSMPSTDQIPLRLMIVNQESKQSFNPKSEMSYLYRNASKLGITAIELSCNREGGQKGTNDETRIKKNANRATSVISDSAGRFYKLQDNSFFQFRWHKAPDCLPNSYIALLENKLQRKKKGPDFFSYFSLKIPEKSVGKRKPIVVPFARDENDVVISCSFENENFAAYMMGASRSGKSTLLHAMICSIITNYHPDEVELWLVDFKRTEFKRYGEACPPHLKYLLLEDSGDLIFDLIDELTDVVNERMKTFASQGWSKLAEVPANIHMPAIFVIIDEFAQVSQKLRDSAMSSGTNYVRALENLLAKGAAFGLKFIFASQSYTTGVEGLSETARKQIQVRFALKNTASEVKDTLDLTQHQMTDRIQQLVSSIRVYETLFKYADESTGAPIVDRYFNLKVEMDELESTIKYLNSNLHPTTSSSGSSTYIDKHPVLLVDDRPTTFRSMVPQYTAFEKTISRNKDYRDTDPDDILIYLGIPCSFKQVKPIVLKRMTSQNLLVVGGDGDQQSSLLLSIINSWRKKDPKLDKLEIWAHEQFPAFKRYKNRWLCVKCECDISKIMTRTQKLLSDISTRHSEDRMVICMGLDLLYEDFEDYMDMSGIPAIKQAESTPQTGTGGDLLSMMNSLKGASQDQIQQQIVTYNQTAVSPDALPSSSEEDFRKNMGLLISKASKKGVHFAFFFTKHRDYCQSKLDQSLCQHRVVFPMPKAESQDIASVDASAIGDGEFLYSDGYRSFSMRPHIYKGIPCNGWIVENNKIVKL